VNPTGWKARAAWPAIWLANKLYPLMRWFTLKVDRWLDK
jgi:hypothetical protein